MLGKQPNALTVVRARRCFDGTFPELKQLPDETRDHLAMTCKRHKVWRIPTWWLFAFYLLPFVIVWKTIHEYLLPDGKFGEWISNGIGWAITMGLIYSIVPATRRFQKFLVQDELNRLRIRTSICLICHYDLRGTPDESTSCPECGAEIAPVTHEAHNPFDVE